MRRADKPNRVYLAVPRESRGLAVGQPPSTVDVTGGGRSGCRRSEGRSQPARTGVVFACSGNANRNPGEDIPNYSDGGKCQKSV